MRVTNTTAAQKNPHPTKHVTLWHKGLTLGPSAGGGRRRSVEWEGFGGQRGSPRRRAKGGTEGQDQVRSPAWCPWEACLTSGPPLPIHGPSRPSSWSSLPQSGWARVCLLLGSQGRAWVSHLGQYVIEPRVNDEKNPKRTNWAKHKNQR